MKRQYDAILLRARKGRTWTVSKSRKEPPSGAKIRLVKDESMSEIIFIVEDAPEGGLVARAVEEGIFTQAATLDELRDRLRDAVRCHFDEGKAPKLIRIHFVRDEVFAA